MQEGGPFGPDAVTARPRSVEGQSPTSVMVTKLPAIEWTTDRVGAGGSAEAPTVVGVAVALGIPPWRIIDAPWRAAGAC